MYFHKKKIEYLKKAKEHLPLSLHDNVKTLDFQEFLRHNEFELAADSLYEIFDEEEILTIEMWWTVNYIRAAYLEMKLLKKAEDVKSFIYNHFSNLEIPTNEITYDFKVDLYVIPTAKKGRVTPMASGYRAPIFFNKYGTSTLFKFLNTHLAFPGDEVTALAKLSSIDQYLDSLSEKKVFQIKEGNRKVAEGMITTIYNLKLLK